VNKTAVVWDVTSYLLVDLCESFNETQRYKLEKNHKKYYFNLMMEANVSRSECERE
jgi:hypothetical protein